MDYESLLNDKQLSAVKTRSQFVRIIAGAGSGKTRVLTYRIAYLISDMGVDPSRILAIAFTNKVAKEMKDRASLLVNDLMGYTPYLSISTFHSFCSHFLRVEAECIGYPRSYTIYDEADQKALLKNVGVKLGYKKGDEMIKMAFAYISNKKTKGKYPEDVAIKPGAPHDEKELLKFFFEYEKMKEEAYALDFDDLLLKTIWILENNIEVRRKWALKYDHILVDEFQDTNDIQYKLMRLLLTPDTSVYVVGDPDQTIYTWRGANQSIIMNFINDYPDVETVILNENYRSTKTILGAANNLIAYNEKRVKKDLFTNVKGGESIETFYGDDSEDEADWVASKIKIIGDSQKDEDGNPNYRNVAVLYRSSYLTIPFESALQHRGIPFRLFGGQRFYERMEVKDVLAYFNLLINPLDNIAFERIVNAPRRSIGATSVDRIKKEAAAHGLSDLQYMRQWELFKDDSDLKPSVYKNLKQTFEYMDDALERLDKEDGEALSSILRDYITNIGYFDYLKEIEDTDEDRIGNVETLFSDIDNFTRRNENATFEEYLQNVSLLSAQDDMVDANYVSLMTVHVAKGLEYDYVFIIGMNENVFPSARAEMETGRDGKEEERRLAYVAITRAKKKLFCSCNRGFSYVYKSNLVPSKYFREAQIKITRSNAFTYNEKWASNNRYERDNRNRYNNSGYYPDDDYIQEPPKPKVYDKPKTNGVLKWEVGDRCHHEKFGDGVVVTIISDTIIVVDFQSEGKKTLMANHYMLSKISSKGGEA